MRSLLAIIAALLLSTASAHAEVLECKPNSFGYWSGGEAQATVLADDEDRAAGFTIDLQSGAYHQNWNDGVDPVDVTYDVIYGGAYGDEGDFIGWHEETRSLIRIRTNNEEFQFAHDHDRILDVGTCSFISREGQFDD
jgi:hypothetical protein